MDLAKKLLTSLRSSQSTWLPSFPCHLRVGSLCLLTAKRCRSPSYDLAHSLGGLCVCAPSHVDGHEFLEPILGTLPLVILVGPPEDAEAANHQHDTRQASKMFASAKRCGRRITFDHSAFGAIGRPQCTSTWLIRFPKRGVLANEGELLPHLLLALRQFTRHLLLLGCLLGPVHFIRVDPWRQCGGREEKKTAACGKRKGHEAEKMDPVALGQPRNQGGVRGSGKSPRFSTRSHQLSHWRHSTARDTEDRDAEGKGDSEWTSFIPTLQ